MAQAFGHRWGQIIGDVVEHSTRRLFGVVAEEHGLYLDHKGSRAARPGLKVTWKDRYGNDHDLDYVLERGGSDGTRGSPAAFLEVAWRRYTKHSRNKAQEIEGAIGPLAATYEHDCPFLGAVLAGIYTEGSRRQLESRGFKLLYLSYESVLKAFASVGIDAAFDETTAEQALRGKVEKWERLSDKDRLRVGEKLLEIESEQVGDFVSALERNLRRTLDRVRVTILHGRVAEWRTAEEAIGYLDSYSIDEKPESHALRYEVELRYTTGDTIHAIFSDPLETARFLRRFS